MLSVAVCRGSDHDVRAEALRERLSALGHDYRVIDRTATSTVLIGSESSVPADAVVRGANGDFIVAAGMFFFADACGEAALTAFLRQFDPLRPAVGGTRGAFCLLVRKAGITVLLTDELGCCKVYHDPPLQVLSNRFVVVAEAITDPGLDDQGCYEYAWNGAGAGTRTFLAAVAAMPCGNALIVDEERPRLVPVPSRDWRETEAVDGSFDDVVDRHVERCRDLFRAYARWFGDRVNLSLSGGYDSRLLLALLRDAGVSPRLFTYGHPDDVDCRIARELADREGLTCEQVDKETSPPVPVERYRQHIVRNYAWFDGWKSYGLFDGGADVVDRGARVQGGLVKMNGGGGEIYRNFFYLPDRSYTLREVVWSFYATYAPAFCTDRFDARGYEQRLAEAIDAALGGVGGRLSRPLVELVYPLFRNRYWTARVTAENHAFGPSLLPFLEPSVIQGTCDIPIRYKSHGRFEAAMIRRVRPALAAVPSVYGHAFDADPPLAKRLKAQFTYRRPPWLRRWSYRLQHVRPQPMPYFLSQAYLAAVVDPAFPFLKSYFRVDRITDPDVLDRVATMEFICERIAARSS